jgi:hypothetical protein
MLLHVRHYALVRAPGYAPSAQYQPAVPPESWSRPSPSQAPDPTGAGAVASGPVVAESRKRRRRQSCDGRRELDNRREEDGIVLYQPGVLLEPM